MGAIPVVAFFTAPIFVAKVRGYSKRCTSTCTSRTTNGLYRARMPAMPSHPLDGYVQSLPYYIFLFFFPLQKFAYMFLFAFVNIWTVMIRDGYLAKSRIIFSAACRTKHHLYFNHNYGQYTTLWDRLGGSYRKSDDELFREELKIVRSKREK